MVNLPQSKKEHIVSIISILLGLFFLFSAFAKALDMGQFVNVIADYGFPKFKFMAPIVLGCELFLAVSLIFNVKTKLTAGCGVVFIIALTFIYIYGWLFKDILDCGCFGKIKILSSSPFVVLLRNFILIVLLSVLFVISDNNYDISGYTLIAYFLVAGIGSFIGGYTCNYAFSGQGSEKPFKPQTIAEFGLDKYIQTSSDSTYIVFLFSYKCPHCINSIGNLLLYESSGSADRIMGLALEDTSINANAREIFPSTIEIRNLSKEEMTKLTEELPTTLYLRNDSVISANYGELPSPYLLTK